MRVLFTTQPGVGHFHPQVPLIQALADAGHDVAVACSRSFVPTVEARGVRGIPAGLDWDLAGGPANTFPEVADIPPGPRRSAFVHSRVFAGVTAERMAEDVMTLAARWPFDLVVRETMEYGGYLAAEKLGLPHAVVQTTPHRPSVLPSIREPLSGHRARLGLPPDPDLTSLTRYLHLSVRPGSLQGTPLAPNSHSYSAPVFDRPVTHAAPAWVDGPMTSPVVFATLGTVANQYDEGLLTTMLDAARPLAGTLILAVGPDMDPVTFGHQPDHVHIERYVPQSLVFSRCDLVISHGGSGTMMAALAHGLPMVVIPLAADQPINAAMIADRGIGVVVGPGERTVEAIAEAIRTVFGQPSYRRNAERVRDEMAALPGLAYAVGLLERLARDRAPIVSSFRGAG